MSSAGSSCAQGGPGRVLEVVDHVDDDRHVAHRDEADAGRHHLVGGALDVGRDTDQGVVTVAAGDLLEGHAGAFRKRREEGLDRDLVVGQRRLQRSGEQLRGRDRTTTAHGRDLHRSPEQAQHHGHLRRGVGVHQGADGGAAIADGRVRDVAQRQREEGLGAGRLRRAQHLGVARERPDADPGSVHGDVAEVREAVDVDQHRRCGEPHGQQRDQRLAPREHLRPRFPREGGEGLLEGARAHEGEGCGLHRGVGPPEAASSTPPS